MNRNLASIRFRVIGEKKPKWWVNLELSWGHQIVQIGGSYRENWDEISLGFHSWWVRPGYHNEYYDGPHPCISFGFIVLSWEPWGAGEWLKPDWKDGKKIDAPAHLKEGER